MVCSINPQWKWNAVLENVDKSAVDKALQPNTLGELCILVVLLYLLSLNRFLHRPT